MRGLFGAFAGQKPPAPGRGRSGAQYMRGEMASVFRSWQPILRDPREDVRAAYWRAAARTIDTIHNSGWVAGVVNKGCASVIGTGLRLAAKPDYTAIGWTQKASADWARDVERRWELWASTKLECDASGKSDIHQLAKAALRSWFATGEYIAWAKWVTRPESKSKTKLMLIPSPRLTQESNGVDLFQGVRIDKNGMPRSYRLRLTQPILETGQVLEVAARDAGNRPVIVHCFDGDVGQMRGMSPFASVLQVLRQFDDLANATATSANLQALFAATITSSAPSAEILNALDTSDEQGLGGGLDSLLEAKAAFHEKTNIDLGGMGRIAHLFPDEELKFLRSETPNSNYEPFSRWLLREIAACAGFTFEDVTGDYTGATYSSIKMSTTTNWPIQLWRRSHIAAPFYQAAFECWLEEDIEAGLTPFPGGVEGFIANRAAACSAHWRGPPKPVPDEVKAAGAAEAYYGLGVVTQESICADLGSDWEDVQEQLARERDKRKELKLPDPSVIAPPAMKQGSKTDNATAKD